jgi:hypothetical protein
MRQCGCERGDDCTKTTVCAIETAVEDATDMKDQVVEAAKDYVDMLEASVCCPITPKVRQSREKALMDAVNELREWVQS